MLSPPAPAMASPWMGEKEECFGSYLREAPVSGQRGRKVNVEMCCGIGFV